MREKKNTPSSKQTLYNKTKRTKHGTGNGKTKGTEGANSKTRLTKRANTETKPLQHIENGSVFPIEKYLPKTCVTKKANLIRQRKQILYGKNNTRTQKQNKNENEEKKKKNKGSDKSKQLKFIHKSYKLTQLNPIN